MSKIIKINQLKDDYKMSFALSELKLAREIEILRVLSMFDGELKDSIVEEIDFLYDSLEDCTVFYDKLDKYEGKEIHYNNLNKLQLENIDAITKIKMNAVYPMVALNNDSNDYEYLKYLSLVASNLDEEYFEILFKIFDKKFMFKSFLYDDMEFNDRALIIKSIINDLKTKDPEYYDDTNLEMIEIAVATRLTNQCPSTLKDEKLEYTSLIADEELLSFEEERSNFHQSKQECTCCEYTWYMDDKRHKDKVSLYKSYMSNLKKGSESYFLKELRLLKKELEIFKIKHMEYISMEDRNYQDIAVCPKCSYELKNHVKKNEKIVELFKGRAK